MVHICYLYLFTSCFLFYSIWLSLLPFHWICFCHISICQAGRFGLPSFYIIFPSCFIHFHYYKSNRDKISLHIFIYRLDLSSELQNQYLTMYLLISSWMYSTYIKFKMCKSEILFSVSLRISAISIPLSFTILINGSCVHSAT